MTRLTHLTLISLFVVLASCTFATTGTGTEPTIEPLAEKMEALVDAGQFAGTATVVWQGNKLVDRTAFGKRDLDTGAAMKPDTIVRIYSMSKPVTAVAMMVLYDQGKWQPEDPITKFLPELSGLTVFKEVDADGEPRLEPLSKAPTVEQLLTHTAGFSYGFTTDWVDQQYDTNDLFGSASNEEFVAKVARIPLAFQPGAQWRYSIAMDLQGAIIERLSGMSLRDFMKQYIFDPLGMKDTDFYVPMEKMERLGKLYVWNGEALQLANEEEYLLPLNNPQLFSSGGAGLFSTADDYARLGRMLLGKGQLEGERIISADAANLMMSNHLSSELVSGGYGIGIQRIRPGYQYGYNGVVVTDPEAANVDLGRGTYLWDGYASNWFWVDPENNIVFVGIVQRVVGEDGPPVQPLSQSVIRDYFFPSEE
jgi:CubicO group peptidase (beta-lactamase class C family)